MTIEEIKTEVNKLELGIRNPVIFAIFIPSILFILITIATILNVSFSVKLPFVLPSVIYLISIIALGLIYKQKYNEKLSRDLILKIALYSSIIVMISFLMFSIFCFLFKNNSVVIFFALIAIIAFFTNLAVVYFNLNFSNFISLNTIKIPSKMLFSLQVDEKIILRPNRMTTKCLIGNLIIFILLGVYLYYIGIKIFISLGFLSIIVSVGVFVFLIVETIDIFFLSSFMFTNKRIIIKRYLMHSEILLNEIGFISSQQMFDFGTLSIINKNGYILKSAIIANPNDTKLKIEEYIKLDNDKT